MFANTKHASNRYSVVGAKENGELVAANLMIPGRIKMEKLERTPAAKGKVRGNPISTLHHSTKDILALDEGGELFFLTRDWGLRDVKPGTPERHPRNAVRNLASAWHGNGVFVTLSRSGKWYVSEGFKNVDPTFPAKVRAALEGMEGPVKDLAIRAYADKGQFTAVALWIE